MEGIVLDTGAAKTMIHRDLVPVETVSSETVDIQCAHGDIVSYPMAEVSMRVGNHPSQCRQLCQIGCLFQCLWDEKSVGLTSCLVQPCVVVAQRLQRWWPQTRVRGGSRKGLNMRESWGPLGVSQCQRQVHGGMSHWASSSQLL